MAGAPGPRARWARGPVSSSACRWRADAMHADAFEILLAEDSPEDAEMTLRALRRHNLANRVHWVKDGEAALDFALCRGAYAGRDPRQPPKLVLLDIKMPKIDGIEVLRQLKANPETRTIPVVVMT